MMMIVDGVGPLRPPHGACLVRKRYNPAMNHVQRMREKAGRLPTKPGVYLMKDVEGKILYIGKAKSLRNRTRSYFQERADLSPRISIMVGKARSIDFIVTASEFEALILEDNLIKKESPPYNVMLKDDKHYPYLKMTMNETFPRLVFTRRVVKDGSAYFGPYVSAKSVRATQRMVHRIFPLRQSKDSLDGKPRRRPCLNYQMSRCLAPCAGKTDREEYREMVEQVILFLKGRDDKLLARLNEKMMEASRREWFEAAIRYRDQAKAITRLREKQSITDTGMKDEDVIASYERAGKSVIKLLRIRRGKMNADRHFLFNRLDRLDRPETLSAFIRQFYTSGMEIPKTIMVNALPDGHEALEQFLSGKRGSLVKIVLPSRGRGRRLVEMAEKNAMLQLSLELESSEAIGAALEEIKETLGLDALPAMMEAYDISSTGGLASVGSVVVFRDGAPAKGDYRKYRIKSGVGRDDYASLAEVVQRRYERLENEGADFASLMIIDGGKGQVGAIIRRLRDIGIPSPPVVGIAKGADRENPESDEFYFAGNIGGQPADGSGDGAIMKVEFAPSAPGRFMLQRARDEAHRFAGAYHRKLRDKAMISSSLDSVPGIGPKRKKMLLKHFGSVRRARSASVEEISQALGVPIKTATKIHENL